MKHLIGAEKAFGVVTILPPLVRERLTTLLFNCFVDARSFLLQKGRKKPLRL